MKRDKFTLEKGCNEFSTSIAFDSMIRGETRDTERLKFLF